MRDNKLIQLYITDVCNSHCKTCSIWKSKYLYKSSHELRTRDIAMLIALYPNADFVIGGGEAILHSDIEGVLYRFMGTGVNYTLLSNCIMPERLRDLVREYEVPNVTVSFDGVRHDEIRGSRGNTESIKAFREWCKYLDTNFKISYTFSKYNENWFNEDMRYIREVFEQEQIYFCIAQDMRLLMSGECNESFTFKNIDNLKKVLDCDMISEKDKAHIRTILSGDRRKCTSQNNVHTIYSNGDIVRCQSFMSDQILGNINKMTTYQVMKALDHSRNESCQYDGVCDLLCQRRYD